MSVMFFQILTSKVLWGHGGGQQSRTNPSCHLPFVPILLSRHRQIVLNCHNKILGSAFLHPLKCPSLPVESIQGTQLRNQGFSTVLLGHGVVDSRGGKSTWIFRCILKSSCHRHPCVLFSHPKSCLAEKIPKKNSPHPRPSRLGASVRNNGLSFPSKKYIFC